MYKYKILIKSTEEVIDIETNAPKFERTIFDSIDKRKSVTYVVFKLNSENQIEYLKEEIEILE